MAAPGNFLKVVFNYQLYGVQTASFSFLYKFTASFGSGGAQTYLDSVINSAFTAGFRTYLISLIPASCSITHIDTYVYQPDMATLFDKGTKSYNTVGTMAIAGAPPQSALVVSLRTPGFGRAYRGRVYLPCQLAATLTTGRLLASQTAACTAAVKAFNAVVTAGGDPIWVINSSSRSASSPVSQIVVDAVYDTQRRRRDKMADPAPSVVAIP